VRSAEADSAAAATDSASDVSGSQMATTKATAVEATAETSRMQTSSSKSTAVETSPSSAAATRRDGLSHCCK
jgi:hypothetical protein